MLAEATRTNQSSTHIFSDSRLFFCGLRHGYHVRMAVDSNCCLAGVSASASRVSLSGGSSRHTPVISASSGDLDLLKSSQASATYRSEFLWQQCQTRTLEVVSRS